MHPIGRTCLVSSTGMELETLRDWIRVWKYVLRLWLSVYAYSEGIERVCAPLSTQSCIQANEDPKTVPDESKDHYPTRQEERSSVRSSLHGMQQMLHRGDQEDSKGQAWRTQTGGEEGRSQEWDCCFLPMSLTTPLTGMRPKSEAVSLDTGSEERLRPSSSRRVDRP